MQVVSLSRTQPQFNAMPAEHNSFFGSKIGRSCLVVAASVFLISAASAQIRLEEKEAEAVTVTVRTIEATNPIVSDSSSSEIQTVANDLEDLRSKLHEIPYQTFRLVSSKEERLCLKKKQSLQLPNGQSLSFRPLYMDGKKVGLWINWKDHDGSGILDTRIHFNSDDSVITGTDQSPGVGTVLAIKAEPIVRKSNLLLR